MPAPEPPDIAHPDSAPQDRARCTITAVSLGPQQSWFAASGELDLGAAAQLSAVLDQQYESGVRFMRLDLSAVTFCDCSCLGVLIDAHHRFRAANGTLVLTGVRPRMAHLITLARLDQALFTIAVPEPDPDAGATVAAGGGPDPEADAGTARRSLPAVDPRVALETAGVRDRALGIIMARRDCTATEAAEALDTLSRSTNRTASEVAHSILNVAARRRWRPAKTAGDTASHPAPPTQSDDVPPVPARTAPDSPPTAD